MTKKCKYCGEEIIWEKEDGRWIPYSPDGMRHNCKTTAAVPLGKRAPDQPDSSKSLLDILIESLEDLLMKLYKKKGLERPAK